MDVFFKLLKRLTKLTILSKLTVNSVKIVLLGFALVGCTSLSLVNSITEIEPPSMQGSGNRIGFELAGVGGKELVLIDDPSKRPVVVNNNLKALTTFFTRTGVSWFPTNNLALSGGIQNSSVVYVKGKINLLGSYREDPELRLVYLSLNFETTYQQAKKSGDANGIGGSTGFPWEGTAQNISGTLGASLGYQLFKRGLIFIGYNYQEFQTTGKVKQSVSTNGTDAGGSYSLGTVSGNTQIIGFGIELRPKNRFFITPIMQYYNFNWGTNKIQDVTGSIRLTYVPL